MTADSEPAVDLKPVAPRRPVDVDALLSDLAHDLNAPLTFLVGYSELLATGQLRGQAVEDACVEIYREACRMADMVAALLETARARLGKVHLDPAPVDLSDLLARVEPRWQCARPDLALTISCASDCALEGDDDQISLAVNAMVGLAAGVAQELPRRAVALRGGPDPVRPAEAVAIRVTGPGGPNSPAAALARDVVAAVAAAHGGEFRAAARAFELSLPRAPSARPSPAADGRRA